MKKKRLHAGWSAQVGWRRGKDALTLEGIPPTRCVVFRSSYRPGSSSKLKTASEPAHWQSCVFQDVPHMHQAHATKATGILTQMRWTNVETRAATFNGATQYPKTQRPWKKDLDIMSIQVRFDVRCTRTLCPLEAIEHHEHTYTPMMPSQTYLSLDGNNQRSHRNDSYNS